jgi:hypothetical protein
MVIKAAGQMPFTELVNNNQLDNKNGKVSVKKKLPQILMVYLQVVIV